jgi:esterase/lipase superfamily enzyme
MYEQTRAKEVGAEEIALHALPGEPGHRLDELSDLLGARRKAVLERGHLVLYVHGRGKHPDTAYDREELSSLERRLDASVVMFHWPSWDGALCLPTLQAGASGRYLREVLAQLAACRETLPGVRVTMVVHSMGNRVLRAAAELSTPPLPIGTVDALVLGAAEVAAASHASWLRRCRFAARVTVLMNPDDTPLCITEVITGSPRLGQGIADPEGGHFELAENARYVYVDEQDEEHDYAMKGSDKLAAYLRALAMDDDAGRSLLRQVGSERVFRLE